MPLTRSLDYRRCLPSDPLRLRLAGLAAGSTAFSVACNAAVTPTEPPSAPLSSQPTPATPTSESTPATARTGMSRVVLVRSEDRVAGTRKAIDLLQPAGVTGQALFLKPNYNT